MTQARNLPSDLHWADLAAARTIEANPGVTRFVVAAGITPSGVVHIGNFREVITVDLVARALRDRGVEVRFIYSWDDFDVFRKVPSDMPEQAMLHRHLRQSIADVPDPFGQTDSYASHHIAAFERSLARLAIAPEFIRQSRRYREGRYAEGIRRALEHRAVIKAILDRHRASPLPDSWLPLSGFLGRHGDEVELAWDGAWTVTLTSRDGSERATVDLRAGGDVKLPWRVDWPMRWAHEQVHFEPGGKDHSSAGGSYDTAKDIVAEVYGFKAPQYVAYDFVRIKGAGGKISSSAGGAVTVDDALEVYEPELLRWIFSGSRPNTELQLSFDGDVIKVYEDFDRAIRLAHEPDDGTDRDRKRQLARRALQFASLEHRAAVAGAPVPHLPPFRGLSMLVQAYAGDLERTIAHAIAQAERSAGPLGPAERARIRTRAACAARWLRDHAPDEFKFEIRPAPIVLALEGPARAALARLVEAIEREAAQLDEPALVPHLRQLFDGLDLSPQAFFPIVYQLLLTRDRGPKLSTLLPVLGPERALGLLRPSL